MGFPFLCFSQTLLSRYDTWDSLTTLAIHSQGEIQDGRPAHEEGIEGDEADREKRQEEVMDRLELCCSATNVVANCVMKYLVRLVFEAESMGIIYLSLPSSYMSCR